MGFCFQKRECSAIIFIWSWCGIQCLVIFRFMFIRQTQTRSGSTGGSCFTHRPAGSGRVGRKLGQHTLLNLGTNFDLPKEAWPELCSRIEQILDSEQALFALDPTTQQNARHLCSRIIARRGGNPSTRHRGKPAFRRGRRQLPPANQTRKRRRRTRPPGSPQRTPYPGNPRTSRPQRTAEWLKETSALGQLPKHDFAPSPRPSPSTTWPTPAWQATPR